MRLIKVGDIYFSSNCIEYIETYPTQDPENIKVKIVFDTSNPINIYENIWSKKAFDHFTVNISEGYKNPIEFNEGLFSGKTPSTY